MNQGVELTRKLVDLFYPLVELTVFNAEGTMQEIFNAFSTLKEDQACDLKNCQIDVPFQQLLAVGRNVRCLIYPLHDGKKLSSYLRLRYDLTHFKNLQEQLNFLVQPTAEYTNQGTTDPWKETIDQIISHYIAEKKINTAIFSLM